MQLLSIEQCATRLSVSKRSVRRLIDRGELRKVKVGGLVRVREEDLLSLINGEESEAA